MKIVILYSRHETGQQQQAALLAQELGSAATPVDVADAFDGAGGEALKSLLGPREFPCVIGLHDHFQGAILNDTLYIKGAMAEQKDIEDREVHKKPPGHLQGMIDQAVGLGRKQVADEINSAADLAALKQKFAPREPGGGTS